MRYIFISCIIFFSLSSLAYAEEDVPGLCTGEVTHDYTRLISTDGHTIIEGKINMKKKEVITNIEPIYIQYQHVDNNIFTYDDYLDANGDIEVSAITNNGNGVVEDFGEVQYGFDRDDSGISAKYTKLDNCHIEKLDEPPYYQLVYNDPSEYLYQKKAVEMDRFYKNILPQFLIDDSDTFKSLVIHKNSLCTDDWRFCFNVDRLLEANPKPRIACYLHEINDVDERLPHDHVNFLTLFSSPKNKLDRNTGIVTLYDETHKDNKTSHFTCTYSMEEGFIKLQEN